MDAAYLPEKKVQEKLNHRFKSYSFGKGTLTCTPEQGELQQKPLDPKWHQNPFLSPYHKAIVKQERNLSNECFMH
jgi:hypothetical protein